MALESKSIFELRAIAQALGMKFEWDDSRSKLVQEINETAYQKLKPCAPPPLV